MDRYPDDILNLQTIQGFVDAVAKECKHHRTQREAYEAVEERYNDHFGRYRYACYENFIKQRAKSYKRRKK